MSVLVVGFYFANLLGGGLLVLASWWLARRHRYPFLRALLSYEIAYALYAFLFFVGQFSVLRIEGLNEHDRYLIYQYLAALAAPIWCLFVWLQLIWSGELADWSRPRWLAGVFWSVQLLLIATAFYGMLVLVPAGRIAADQALSRYLTLGFVGELLLSPLVLLLRARRLADRQRRRLTLASGLASLAGYASLTLGIYLHLPGSRSLDGYLLTHSLLHYLCGLPLLATLALLLPRGRIARELPHHASRDLDARLSEQGMTRREREVATLVGKGLTNEEVGEALFISAKTVKNNLSAIYRKTALRNRVELANLVGELERGQDRLPS